jgi:hypothetical protein
MSKRSLVHMLNTFAMRLEIDHGPKDAVKAIQLFARDRTIRRAEHRDRSAEEEKRVERQRTLFNMLPSCDAVDRLKAAMLQRAYDLLWDGDAFGCDALLEFLPSTDADALLNAWCADQDNDDANKPERSKWYGGKAA